MQKPLPIPVTNAVAAVDRLFDAQGARVAVTMRGSSNRISIIRRTRGVIVAGTAGLLLVACAPAAATDGPLRFNQDENTICGPVDLYAHAALGTELKTDSDSEIVIDDVEPVNPDGVRFIGAKIMPLASDSGGFMFSEYPPVDQYPDQWPLSAEAADFTFDGANRAAIVAEFEYTGSGTGMVDGLLVKYSVGDRKYTARTYLTMVISDKNCDDVSG